MVVQNRLRMYNIQLRMRLWCKKTQQGSDLFLGQAEWAWKYLYNNFLPLSQDFEQLL